MWVQNEQICVDTLIRVHMPRMNSYKSMMALLNFYIYIYTYFYHLPTAVSDYDAVSPAPPNLHLMPNRLVHLPVRPPWHGALEFLVTPKFLQLLTQLDVRVIGWRPALLQSHATICYMLILMFVPFDALLISVEVKFTSIHISKLEEITLWPCSKRWPLTSCKDGWNVGRIGPHVTNGPIGRLEVLQVRVGVMKLFQKDHGHWTDMPNMSNRFSTYKLHIQLRLVPSRAFLHEARQCRVLRAQIPRSDAHLACIFECCLRSIAILAQSRFSAFNMFNRFVMVGHWLVSIDFSWFFRDSHVLCFSM